MNQPTKDWREKYENIGPVLHDEETTWLPKNKVKSFIAETLAEQLREIKEYCFDERDKIAKEDEDPFDDKVPEYNQGYWMAMNSVAKLLEAKEKEIKE